MERRPSKLTREKRLFANTAEAKAAKHKRELEYQKSVRAEYKRQFAAGERTVAEGRTCSKCKQYKGAAHYDVVLTMADGLYPHCKDCHRASAKTPEAKAKRMDTYHSPKLRERRKVERWAETLFNTAKNCTGPKRGLSFNLPSPDFLRELWVRQSGHCYWFQIPMVPSSDNKHPYQPSLERLDCTRGYETDNVVLVCDAANRGRGATDLKTWQEFCRQLFA